MNLEREPTEDESAGMTWWNSQTMRARAIWHQRTGTAVAADAWALMKANPGLASGVGEQEARELEEDREKEIARSQVVRKLGKDLELDDVLVIQGNNGKLYGEKIRDIQDADVGSLLVRSGPVGHAVRSVAAGERVDVVRR